MNDLTLKTKDTTSSELLKISRTENTTVLRDDISKLTIKKRVAIARNRAFQSKLKEYFSTNNIIRALLKDEDSERNYEDKYKERLETFDTIYREYCSFKKKNASELALIREDVDKNEAKRDENLQKFVNKLQEVVNSLNSRKEKELNKRIDELNKSINSYSQVLFKFKQKELKEDTMTTLAQKADEFGNELHYVDFVNRQGELGFLRSIYEQTEVKVSNLEMRATNNYIKAVTDEMKEFHLISLLKEAENELLATRVLNDVEKMKLEALTKERLMVKVKFKKLLVPGRVTASSILNDFYDKDARCNEMRRQIDELMEKNY